MTKLRFGSVITALALAAFFACPCLAQSTFGTILGTVTDASGAVEPNMIVTVTNQDENISRDYRTDAQGNYQAENLKEGIYTVSVKAAGFKEITVRDIRLTARQIVRNDLRLVVGAATEKVSVVADAELINTESQGISTSATSVEVLELPANYRGAGSTSPISLLPFLPGVTGDKYGQVSVQGTGVNQTEYTVDGISTSSVRYSGPQTEMFPSVEAISEISVQGSGNSAEYGQASDVTTTSKAGSNNLHGSLFEYFQNAALDAFQTGNTAKPAKSANTFGGSLSGPIFKNHTFFFADYEGMRYRTTSPQVWTVPTAAMRTGDFSAFCSSYDPNNNFACNDPNGLTLTDPFTGNPFPNNMISPTEPISSVAGPVLNFYPLPNVGDPNSFQGNNYIKNFPNPILSDQFDVRIDHTINSKHSVFGRWTYKNKRQVNPIYGDLLLPSDRDFEHDNQIVIAHNFIITPNLINELRGGISWGDQGGSFSFDGPGFMQTLGLNPQELGPFPAGGFPEFAFEESGVSRIFHSRPPDVLSHNLQISENLSWTKGRHTMKFGFDFRHLRLTDVWRSTNADDYGDFYFNGEYAGNDFAEFLLGIPYFTYVTHTPPNIDGSTSHYYGFAEDTFKATRKLTLDVGLRISRLPPFIDPINHTNFDPSVPGTGRVIISSDPRSLAATQPLFAQNINACNSPNQVNPNPDPNSPCTPFLTAKQAHWPEGLRETYTDFSPRVGFAFRPFDDNKTVLRGGIGIYTVTTLGAVFYSVAGIHDGFQASYYNAFSTSDPTFFKFPDVESSSTLYGLGAGTQRFETANQFAKKDPYSIQWNLSVERVLHGNTALRVSYIANRGVQLSWGPDLNQPLPSTTPYSQRPLSDRPFPEWSNVYTRAAGAVSTYESMQTEIIHKYSHGLTFQSTWTWARNLADTESWPGSVFSGEVTGRTMNRLNLRGDYGNVGGTRKHRWITTMVDELPIGKGRALLGHAGGVLNGIVGGWRLSMILLAQTGAYETPFIFFDSEGMNTFNRPDVIGKPNISHPTSQQWWDITAFACPGQTTFTGTAHHLDCSNAPVVGRFGNSGVGTLVGPKTVNLSLGLAKDFQLSERFRLKFESSFTNIPNHVNWDDPANSLTDSNFGQVAFARGGDAGGNRVGQLALRLEF